jgi:hypothetical protein
MMRRRDGQIDACAIAPEWSTANLMRMEGDNNHNSAPASVLPRKEHMLHAVPSALGLCLQQ